ncbi:hypothetical protein KKF32_00380 [Patescibacteria group bacterium]|nr:hypothetical protein [Patescibacteria group bacterium]
MLEKYTTEIKIFFKRMGLFLLPIIILIVILEYFSYTSGELWPIKKVIAFQNKAKEEVLFNRKVIDDEIAKYKYLNILERNLDILVIGSSRSMQIRQEMFSERVKFYNAGGIIYNVGDMLDFINNLPVDKTPEMMILNVDFYWFGDKREVTRSISKALSEGDTVNKWESHLYANKYLLSNLLQKRNIFSEIIKGREKFEGLISIGFQALDGNGFRHDGSYQYGLYLSELRKNLEYYDRKSYLFRIENGISPFIRNSVYDSGKVEILEEFLKICKSRGIKVIAFAPPMSTEIYEAVNESIYHKDLINNFRSNIGSIFAKYDYNYYDFTELRAFNLTDLYMFDGLHSTETAMAKILLEMSLTSDLEKILSHDLKSQLADEKTTPFEINWK